MELKIVISSTILVVLCHAISCSEMYSKMNVSVVPSKILSQMENFKEVECILGCKAFSGCGFASFKILSKKQRTGVCLYHAIGSLDDASNTKDVIAYTSK